MKPKIVISIVEDNRYVREGWRAVLQAVPDFQLLGVYENCEDAFQNPEIGKSHVVLMDIGLPGMSGIEGVKYLVSHFPKIAVVMCTVYDDEQKVFDAICAGAVGYLLKKTPAEELIRSLRDAAQGGSPMTPNIARKVLASFQQPHVVKTEDGPIILSDKEKEVLNLLAQGKSYIGIGDEIFLSVDGVRYHIRHIYEKLQVNSRSEATAKGLKYRLIQPPK